MYIQEFGRVTAPQLSHMFQSFKLNRKMNRCLRQGFCSSWKYVFVYVLFFSSFYHIKTGQSDSGPPIFILLYTDLHCNGHLLFCGGNTVLYFVCLFDRKISESTQRFQWVIPEDSVTFQQAEWAPRLRPERGQGNRETEREQSRKKHRDQRRGG